MFDETKITWSKGIIIQNMDYLKHFLGQIQHQFLNKLKKHLHKLLKFFILVVTKMHQNHVSIRKVVPQ